MPLITEPGSRVEVCSDQQVARLIDALQRSYRREERLKARLAELEQREQTRNENLAAIEHELGNAVFPLKMAVEICSEPEGKNHLSFEELRGTLGATLPYLCHSVDEIRSLRAEGQLPLQLNRVRCTARQLVDHAMRAIRPLVEDRGHQLIATVAPETVQLDVDPVAIERVLVNLLNNAIKYMDPGGQITLDSSVQGTDVVFCVSDTGIGMDARTLSCAFDLYARGEHATGGGYGNLGVGLAFVKKIVELHGGRVQATSEGPGRGSAFIVRLPLAPEDEPGCCEPMPPESPAW